MPCSAASLRTAGESRCLSPPSATSAGGAAAGAGALPPAGPGGASVCATPASFGFGWVAAPAAAAPVSICAMTAPTRTVSPSLTAIFTSLPSNGEGISALTLSVTTSTKGSSRLTKSPSRLSHLSTVPSVTDSPSWGILICDTPMSASVPEGEISLRRDPGIGRMVDPPSAPVFSQDGRWYWDGPLLARDDWPLMCFGLEATPRIELGMEVLQTSALPLGYVAARS